jgi:hypothetical protein
MHPHAVRGAILLGFASSLVALFCLSLHADTRRSALLSGHRGGRTIAQALTPGKKATVATRLLRNPTFAGQFAGALVNGIRRDVKRVEHDGNSLQPAGESSGELPSMRQILRMRQMRTAERDRRDKHYQKMVKARAAQRAVKCEGKSVTDCDLSLDEEALAHVFKAAP